METKKCTNCSRAEQKLSEFINKAGRECNTCAKCREKGRRNDKTDKRIEAHNKLQNEKKYYRAWREKKREQDEEAFKQHNNDVQKQWRENNPGHISQWYRTSVNSRLDAIKRSAVKRKIEWNLDDEEARVMLTQPCVYCGHLDLSVRVNGIDRMDSFGPYSKENCVPCCKNCNYMKCEYDPFSFIEMCKRISQCTYDFPIHIRRSAEI